MPDVFAYSVAEADSLATVRAAMASPINFGDTAASYGDGESERRIGKVVGELGGLPDGYVLATKADRDLSTGDFSGEAINRSVERSLRLLGLDRLQLVHLHDPEHSTFNEVMAPGGPVDVLNRFKEAGVIGHLGVAGGPVDLMMRYVETGAFEAVITHNRYTLLNRSATELIDMAAQRGLAVINAAPYGSGILARGPAAYPRYAYQNASRQLVERTGELAAICAGHGVPLAAAALQFSLRNAHITATIVGASQPQRIARTLELAACQIPEALWDDLHRVPVAMDDPEVGRFGEDGRASRAGRRGRGSADD